MLLPCFAAAAAIHLEVAATLPLSYIAATLIADATPCHAMLRHALY